MKVMLTALAAILCTALALPSVADAAAVTQETEYRISLAGLPVARAVFSTRLEKARYKISGHVNTSGLVDLIADIRADTQVTGTLGSGGTMQAQNYDLTYSSGDRTRVYRVKYRLGQVTDNSIDPQPVRPDTWVPVTPHQLKAVLDPISGLIFPEGKRICPRSLAIFDGETRMDLVLAKRGVKTFTADGYSGDALVCSVRFVPKGGYKKDRKDIEFLRKSGGMEIWFAKAGKLRLMAPVYVRIPTQVGMLTISAHKITN